MLLGPSPGGLPLRPLRMRHLRRRRKQREVETYNCRSAGQGRGRGLDESFVFGLWPQAR